MNAETPALQTPKKRRWYLRRDIRFIMVVAVFLAVFYGHGFVNGPLRLGDELQTVLAENPTKVDIIISTEFPPEQFHLNIFQNLGSLRGTKGRKAILFGVRPADVRSLSRHYWIDNIDLAKNPVNKRN